MPDKIEQGSMKWNMRLAVLAERYLNIEFCLVCGSPTVEGYECTFCPPQQKESEEVDA